jgi:ferrous iron transport protein A
VAPIELTQLEPGRSGRISADPVAEVPERLLDLGFVPGTEVAVVRRGVLGDPIEIELRGYRICVRREDLGGLRVVPLGVAP